MTLSSAAEKWERWILFLALFLCGQGLLITYGLSLPLSPAQALFTSGMAIVGASYISSWAAERSLEHLPGSLAIALLSIVTTLPEFVVDMYYAWQSQHDLHYAALMGSNVTGANRLLIGLGCGIILLLNRQKRTSNLSVPPSSSNDEFSRLILAAVFGLFIAFFRQFSWINTIFFLGLFAYHLVQSSKTSHTHNDSLEETLESAHEGPPQSIWGHLWVGLCFVIAAATLVLSGKPFAESLLHVAHNLAVSEFITVQWLAPIASETPELLMAGYFAYRQNTMVGLKILGAAMLNQWCLLVGLLPLAYHFSTGDWAPYRFEAQQSVEWFLMASSTLAGVAVLKSRFPQSVKILALLSLYGLNVVTNLEARQIFGIIFLLASLILFAISMKGLNFKPNNPSDKFQ